jgi:hypothetical protein
VTYQIKDWESHFENDRSKGRDRCSFVCIPNKQHGMGFSRIVAEKDGAMVYGIWHMIVGACSQQKRPRGGWLTDDGSPTGTSWTAEDLAVKFRRPVAEIRRGLEVLCSPKVGWLAVHNEVSPKAKSSSHHELTMDSPSDHLEGKGREEEGMEMNGRGSARAEPGATPARFVKPTLEEVRLAAAKVGLPEIEAERFFNYHESKGWKIGNSPMKSMPHALANWKLNMGKYEHRNNSINRPNPRNAAMGEAGTDYAEAYRRKAIRAGGKAET